MDSKGSRSPKQIATIAVCDPIFHLLSLLLCWGPCGDRILRSCLQTGPATTPANYSPESRAGGYFLGVVLWKFRVRASRVCVAGQGIPNHPPEIGPILDRLEWKELGP